MTNESLLSHLSSAEESNRKCQLVKIAVEGNIGAGKSTLLKHLADLEILEILPEPIDDWKNCAGINLLDLSYKDAHRWMFTFQTFANITLARQITKTPIKPIRIMEGSLYAAHYCWTTYFRENKILDEAEFYVLDQLFQMLINNNEYRIDLIIYLKTDPLICMERIRTRNQNSEDTVDAAYINTAHELLENLLNPNENSVREFVLPNVVIINGNQSEEVILAETKKLISDTKINKNIELEK